MFTRCQLGFCHADVLDHIAVSVYDLNTNQIIGAGRPQKNIDGAQGVAAVFSLNNHYGSPKIDGVAIPSDPRKLPLAEFDKARPVVLRMLSERVIKTMRAAGL